jgi:hypothetical protein
VRKFSSEFPIIQQHCAAAVHNSQKGNTGRRTNPQKKSKIKIKKDILNSQEI